jgi:hypothetical protein
MFISDDDLELEIYGSFAPNLSHVPDSSLQDLC